MIVKSMRVLSWVLGGVLLLLLLAFSIAKIDDADTMQYLANGKMILSHGFGANFCTYNYVPHSCQLSYTHEWLFHLMTYAVYLAGQWNALVLFQVAIVLAIFSVLFYASRTFHYSFFSTSVFIFFAILIGMERFMVRADLFGILLAVLFYFITRCYLEGGMYEKKGAQKVLPLILLFGVQIIWANSHASFPLAFMIIFVYAFSYIAHYLWDRYVQKDASVKFLIPHLVGLLSVLAVTTVASMLNPFGLRAFFDALNPSSAISRSIQEWRPPFAPADFQHFAISVYFILFFAAIALIILSIRKLQLADALILIVFGYLSVSYARDTALFAVFCVLILPYYLDRILESTVHLLRKIHHISRYIAVGELVVMTALIVYGSFLIYSLTTNKFYTSDLELREFGIGLSEKVYPVAAANFIDNNNLGGNMFNNFDIGTYLNWRLYPKRQTFIDGDLFSQASNSYYDNIMAGNIGYNDAANKYHINYFVLNYASTDTPGLISSLYSDKNWVPVYFDELSVIFVKNIPENKAVIDKYAINFQAGNGYDPDQIVTITDPKYLPEGFVNRGTFLNQIGLRKEAYYEFQKAVDLGTNDDQAYVGLGVIYGQSGSNGLAIEALKKAVDLAPGYAPDHFDLGLSYFNNGMYDQALEEFNHTLSINNTYQKANYAIGVIYLKKGDTSSAKNHFLREL
jgi:tetratricopeptide (TPR) repeat protein